MDLDKVINKMVNLGIIRSRHKILYYNMLSSIKYEHGGRIAKWDLKRWVQKIAKEHNLSERQIYNHFRRLRELGIIKSEITANAEYWALSDDFGSKLWGLYKDYRNWLKE